MAVRRVQLRRGTTAQNDAFKGVEGEITVDTTTKSIRVHDDDQAGGFDLMRADMSNQSFAESNLTIADGVGANTLTIGAGTTTVRIPGTLTVVGATTNENNLLVQDKAIVLADGTEGAANSTDSIGMIFTRTLAGGGGAQHPATFFWKEEGDTFILGTASVTESDADWSSDGDFAFANLAMASLTATGLSLTEGNITNVADIALDTISADETTITINATDNTQSSFVVKTSGGEEYINVDGRDANMALTLGVVASTTTIQSNTIALGTDAANNVSITVAERSGDNDGQSLTISAGSSAAGANDNNGGDLILASGGGDGTGTSSIQFKTKVSGTDTSAERMRIHTDGTVGIGTATPSSLLHISGADTSTLTLENTTGGNGQDDDESTIQFIGNGQAKALAQIVGAHDGVADDDKGVLIFKPNNDTDPTEALRLASDLLATFAGNVKISGTGNNALDFTDADVKIGHTLGADKALTLGGGTVKTTGDLTIEGKDVVLGTDGGGATTLKAATTAGGAGNDLTISSGVGNNPETNDGDLVLASGAQTALTISPDKKASFAGEVEIATSLDLTDGAISNVTSIDLDKITNRDNDGIIIEIHDGQAAGLVIEDTTGLDFITCNANTNVITLVQATSLSSSLTVAGASNLNGGITVDTDNFTVDGATGAIDTKSTLQVDGNTTLGADGLAGSPNFTIIEHNAGAEKFKVVGASGNTTVGGTLGVTGLTTLSSALNIVMDVADGILFNSDRGEEGDKDAALIKVKDAAGGTDGVLSWDDGLNTFSFSGSKLNSVLDFSVGTLAAPSTTISATTGAIATAGTAPVLTLKNTTGGNANGDSPTQVIFQDDAGQSLAQIQGSHDGVADDTKGDLIFSTNSGGGLVEALRLDSANLATFAGSATVSGGTITVGSDGATITGTTDGSNVLTLTETTVAISEALTVGTNLTVGGNILGDGNEAKVIFAASADEASTITLGGGGTVISGGKLRLGSNIIENSASETTITLNANQRTTLSGDLAVVGGATGGLAATTILLGADAARDSKISVVARTGAANAGQNLTIEAGSSATGGNNLNGGNLILASGGGDGTGTSDIILNTKTNGTDSATEKVRILGSGNVGIGDTAPGTMLQISGADAYLTLKNTTAENGEGGAETKIIFEDHGDNALAQIEGSHHGTDNDNKGKLILSVNDHDNGLQTALTIDSTKLATFAGGVTVTGDLTVQGDTTTVNTATLDVEDAVIRINKGVAGGANTSDIGIFFERGTDGDDGIFFWGDDESYFILGTTSQDDHTVVDFAGTTTPGGLQIGSLELRDDNATSLVIKEAGNAYLTFNTTDAGEKIVFGKVFEGVTSSKIGNLTLANGSITDSGGTVSFGANHIDTTGLASLDGGINVLDKFTVDNAGATVVLNTLTLNEATGNLSDFDVQSNGTSVFKVDVSAKDAIVGATSTLFTNKIQATSDANDSFQLYLKDNTALGLVVSNVSDNVDFITVKTTTNSELITLAQATSISETLEVVGNATFDAEVHIETANANGIFFNQDGSGNASADATLITIEGGNNKTDVVLAWDTSDNALNLNAQSSLHLQGVAGGDADALTIGGALKTDATASIKTDGSAVFTSVNAGNTITNAGAVSGVTSIAGTSMDITLANNDADALEIMGDVGAGDAGDHAYLSFVTTNQAEEVVVNQEGEDIDFRVEGDSATHLIFAQASNDRVGIKNSNPQFDLDITGTLGVSSLADLNGGIDVNGNKFTVTNAGVVTSVGGITDTTVASAFKDGTTLGNVTYNDNEIEGADAEDLTIKSKQDIIFNIDSDNNDNAGKKFSFSHNANAEIASINDSGDLTLTGNATLNGGDLTVKNATATEHAVISLISDNASNDGDTWKLDAADDTATLTVFNNVSGGDVAQLTLLGNATATSGLATFAGKVKINASGASALDFTDENTTIGGSIGATHTLTLGGGGATVSIPGDLKVATTKSLTLNNGVANAAADVDAYIYVDRGAQTDVAIRWDEGTDRWMHSLNGTDYYNILNANDTLFTLVTDSGNASAFTFEQTDGSSLTFTDGGNAQIVVTNNSATVSLSLEDSFDVVRDLGVGRNLTVTGNIIGNGSRVSFNDPIIQIGDGNTSNVNDLGFYGEYANSAAASRFAGLLYQPESASNNGVWKLFDLHTANIGSLDTNVTVADGELSTLDINEVRGGSKVGVGDNEAGTDLTISGGASTGNGAGGSIVFKVAEASQGAGATERLPTTTALTVNASKRVITAGDLAVGGQAVVDSSTLTLGVGDDSIAVTKSFHKITPDNGNNTVATITGGETGSILILMHSGAGGTLTLTNDANNGTANGLALDGGDITLAGKSTVTLIYTGSNWSLVSKAIVS